MLYLTVVMWCHAATWSVSQSVRAWDQFGPVWSPLTATADLDTGNGNLDLLNSQLSPIIKVVSCFVNWLDTGHWTLDTGQDRTNYQVPAIHCSFNKTLLLQLQLEHRSRLQNRSNYSSITGETVANQLNDKIRHKNSKSAWHGTVSLFSVGSLIVK